MGFVVKKKPKKLLVKKKPLIPIQAKTKYIDAWTSGKHVKLTYRNAKGRRCTETIEDYGMTGWYFYISKVDFNKIDPEIVEALEENNITVIKHPVRFEQEAGNWVKVFVANENRNERYSDRSDDRIKLKKLLERDGVKVCEADLKPHKRYCLDNKVETSDDYKVLYYDIETDDRTPGFVIGRDRILTIAGVDQDGKEYFFHNEDEALLLEEFYNFIRWDYDILVGYNSDNFDKPYIEKRLKEHFMEDEMSFFKYRIAHVDIMSVFIKRLAGDSEITSWSLEFISNYFLGHGKTVGGPKFGDGKGYKYYRENFEKFKEYNIGDAKNLYELNQVLGTIDQIILECQICGAFPSKFSISEILDSYILKSVHGKDIHFASIEYSENLVRCPTCNHSNTSEIPLEEIVGEVGCTRCGHRFEPNSVDNEIVGAHVFDPVAGLHNDVFVLDYSSLYPSIIRTWNIGPDTFLEPSEEEEVAAYDVFDHFLKSANDQHFTHPESSQSAIKEAIEKLLTLRKTYKAKMNSYEDGTELYKAFKAKQNAVKLLANSIYGLMGYQFGRYYRKEIAEAITLGGQWLNKHTKTWFEAKGYEVVYGDSVTSDRYFLVRGKGNDWIENISIEDVYLRSSGLVMSDGKHYKNKVPFQTVSVSKDGVVEFKDIKYIYRHKAKKKVFDVVDNKGSTCVTEDHSLINSKLEKVKHDEIDTLFSIKDKIIDISDGDHCSHVYLYSEIEEHLALPSWVYNVSNLEKLEILNSILGCDVQQAFSYITDSKERMNNICSLMSLCGVSYNLSKHRDLMIITDAIITIIESPKSTERDYDGFVYDLEVVDNHNFFDTMGFIGLHNTDSVFVKGDKDFRSNLDSLLKELHEFYDEGLKEYFGINQHYIELEYEKHFKRLLLLKKKHYSGRIVELDGHKTDKFIVKGLECIKRDTIPLGKKWQRELLEMIIKEDHDVPFYVEWVENKMESFFNNEFDLEDIIVRKKLTKNPTKYKVMQPHVVIAKEMLEREMECYVGMQIPFVVISDKPIVAVHPDWYEGNASISYYWDLKVYGILKRVLEIAFPDYDWDQYTTKIKVRRQKKTDQYLKWFRDPKRKRKELLAKLKEDKLLSDLDKKKIRTEIGIKTFKVKKIIM